MKKSTKKSTKRYLIPIRYWADDADPIEVHLIGSEDNYVYHTIYRHNVYVDPKELFKTKTEANKEIKKRLVIRGQQTLQEIDRLMQELYKKGVF